MKNITDLKTVRLSDDQNAVVILDQTRLPAEECYLELTSAEDIWDAIYKLKVRGAPAIGVAAAYGIYVCSRQIEARSFDEFYTAFRRVKEYLAGSRPTAVNLVAALNRMEKVVLENASETVPAFCSPVYPVRPDAHAAEKYCTSLQTVPVQVQGLLSQTDNLHGKNLLY